MDIDCHFSLDGHSVDSVLLLQPGSALAGEILSTILVRDNLTDKMRP